MGCSSSIGHGGDSVARPAQLQAHQAGGSGNPSPQECLMKTVQHGDAAAVARWSLTQGVSLVDKDAQGLTALDAALLLQPTSCGAVVSALLRGFSSQASAMASRGALRELSALVRELEKAGAAAARAAAAASMDQWMMVHRMKGHSNIVPSVCFSPDGALLASGSFDYTVKLWDPQAGQLVRTLQGHEDGVVSVCFCPDGAAVAAGSRDLTVKVWDPQSGRLLHTLRGHTAAVEGVCFAPDGTLLASGSRDSNVKLWDTKSGGLVRTLEGHGGPVQSVCFSPDGAMLASGAGVAVCLWRPQSGQLVHKLKGHSQAVTSVCFSLDGAVLASGSYDKSVKLWDLQSRQLVRTLQAHDESCSVDSVCFSPDGTLLASGCGNNTVQLWEPQSGRRLHTLTGKSVCFSPDGSQVATGGKFHDNSVQVWSSARAVLQSCAQRISAVQRGLQEEEARLREAQLKAEEAAGALKSELADAACRAVLAGDRAALIASIDNGGAAALHTPSPAAGATALHLACSAGNTRMLAVMLRTPELDLECVAAGATPLHAAVASGQERCVELLLGRADPNARRAADGRTPLMVAVQASSLSLTNMLASSPGVDVSAQDDAGDTALHLAVQGQSGTLARLLLDAGADPDVLNEVQFSPLMMAVQTWQPELVSLLLDARSGADPDVRGAEGKTALMLAVAAGDPGLALVLLEGGADPDVVDDGGSASLTVAVQRGDEAAARVLLEQGRADPDPLHPSLGTPLHVACAAQAADMARLLLEQGAGVEVQHPVTEDTPLLIAVRLCDEALVRLLLENGADPAVLESTEDKAPPLLVAAQAAAGAPHSGIMQLLLDAGASPAIPDAQGNLPLCRVLLRPDPQHALAKALIARGAPVDAIVDRALKETLLHQAARAGDEAAVNLLLEAGADPTATNSQGYTADLVAKSDQVADIISAAAADWGARPGPSHAFAPVAHGAAPSADRPQVTRAAVAPRAARPPREKVQRMNRLLEEQLKQKAQAEAMDVPPRQVFLSFRVREAKTQALAIKRELQARGMDAFCSECDIPPGADWIKTIFEAMKLATVMVILASETYGSAGTDVFATYEELLAAKKTDMPIYVVTIHRHGSVKEFGVQALLNPLQGAPWLRAEDGGESDNRPSVKILDDIETMVKAEAAKGRARA